MALTLKKNVDIAVMEESTEGTYVAPASGADYLAAIVDGNTISPSKEAVERNVLNGSLVKENPRHGIKSVAGNIQVELKANGTEGASPEFEPLIKSALGGSRNAATQTSGTTNTSSVINFADTSMFAVGDIVVVKEAGAFHASPIASIVTDTSITLEIAASGAFSDNVEVAAYQTYYGANSGHPSLSVSKYDDDAVLEKAVGCKVNSMSMSDFTPGGTAKLDFSFEGLDFDRTLTANPYDPSFDAALPPIILSACVYMDGALLEVSEVSLSVENTLAFKTTTCSANGRVGSTVTERVVSGSFTSFKESDDLTVFNKFNDETEFSLFLRAYIPSATTGEYEDSFAVWLPKCKANEISDSDQDGIQQDSVSFTASVDANTNDIVVSFS